MGDIADAIINGEICQICTQPLEGEPNGYPESCEECIEDGERYDGELGN